MLMRVPWSLQIPFWSSTTTTAAGSRVRIVDGLTAPGTFFCNALLVFAELAKERQHVRKLIAFDDDTFDKLKQLARDRMATIQELADEAFADVLRKHGIPVDLKDALRKSASLSKMTPPQKPARSKPPRKPES